MALLIARLSAQFLRCNFAAGILLAAAGFFATTPGRAAESAVSREYEIKAAFLFNFLQFVEWSEQSFGGADGELRIGVLGDDPFGLALDETVRGERINNHPLRVVRSRDVGELQDCHVVFVSRSEKSRFPEILARLARREVLVVGESEGFAAQGGVINFYLEGNRVRFEINATSARERELKINAQLLSLGKIVNPPPPSADGG